MDDICEICGKKIKFPNFVVTRTPGLCHPEDEFCECARCELDHLITQYMEFKDEINDPVYHYNALTEINQFIIQLNRTTLF